MFHGLKQGEGGNYRVLEVQRRLFDTTRDIGIGSKMENQVDLRMKDLFEAVLVANIHFDKLEILRTEMMRNKIAPAAAQVIEHHHSVTIFHQAIDQIGTNEDGASCHDDFHYKFALIPISVASLLQVSAPRGK